MSIFENLQTTYEKHFERERKNLREREEKLDKEIKKLEEQVEELTAEQEELAVELKHMHKICPNYQQLKKQMEKHQTEQIEKLAGVHAKDFRKQYTEEQRLKLKENLEQFHQKEVDRQERLMEMH